MQFTMFDCETPPPGLIVLDSMYLNSDELAMMSGLNVALKEARQISYSLAPTAVFPVLEAAAAAADDFRVSTAEFQSFLRSTFFCCQFIQRLEVFSHTTSKYLFACKSLRSIFDSRAGIQLFFFLPGCQTSPLNPWAAARSQDFGYSAQPCSSPRLGLRQCSLKLPLHNDRTTSKSADLRIYRTN